MSGAVLLCTVGGRPEPVVSALRALRPSRVLFLVTADLPERAQKGSAGQVPSILAAAGLPLERHELCVVPPDDPDAVFAVARDLLERLASERVTVDYTGGTKSMSAGLLQAALGRPHVRVQIMAGERSDTHTVRAGTERPLALSFDTILAERDLERAAAFWQGHAYGAAAAVLGGWVDADEGRADDLPAELAARIRRAATLSQAFDAWDRFDHAGALELLVAAPDLAGAVAGYLPALRQLAGNGERTERRGNRLRWLPPENALVPLDLWWNAQRRAAQGRFDDAVARCYRLAEATVQWVLWTERGIDTGAVDQARVKPSTMHKVDAHGHLSLTKAYDVLGSEVGRRHPFYLRLRQPMAGRKARECLQDWLSMRNDSIFGHGFRPVSSRDWETVEEWCRRVLVPHLEDRARAVQLGLPQLPTQFT